MDYRLVFGFVLCGCLLYFYWFSEGINEFAISLRKSVPRIQKSRRICTSPPPSSISMFDSCPLKLPDPNDPEIVKAIGSSKDPIAGCKKVPPTTTLFNGTVTYHQNSTSVTCEGRCVTLENHYTLVLHNFTDISKTHYPCDTVEVVCKEKNNTVHGNLLKQIYEHERDRKKEFGDLYRPTKSPKVTDGNFHPNVFVILIDAASVTTSIRSFPKTLKLLREKYDVIDYNFLNKVGINSRPNGLAFLMGKVPEVVNRTVYGEDTIIPENIEQLCKSPLDNEPLVMYEYEDAGYKTMYACNSAYLAFAYDGSCKGIQSQLTTHYMRPFNRHRMKTSGYEAKWESFAPKKCHSVQRNIIDYQHKFVNSYPGIPKMSLIWDTWMAHDAEDTAAHGDQPLLEFFEKNQKMLEDSFVFLMGDHGLRFGAPAQTTQGLYNNNNPMMHISIPKRLRGTKMHEILTKQSKMLSSHHDLHATFLDIARNQPLSNFTDTNYKKIEGSLGSSWLREFEKGKPRNCKTLPIPADYCICDFQSEVDTPGDVKKDVGQTAVEGLNDFISMNNASDICQEYKLDEVKALSFKPQLQYPSAYEVIFKTKSPEAVFVARVGEKCDGSYVMVSDKWGRVDSYGKTSSCLSKEQNHLRELCYCK